MSHTHCKDCRIDWTDESVELCPLHAAVPMLLAALKRAVASDPDSRAWVPEAEAAIAQAEGR